MPKGIDEHIEDIDAGDELEPINGGQDQNQGGSDNQTTDTGVDGGEGQAGQGGEGGDQQPKKVQREELTAEKIAELTAKVTSQMIQKQTQQQRQAPKQLTQEEIDKMLNPVRITKDFLSKHGLIAEGDNEEAIKRKIAYHQELADMQTKHHTSLLQVALEHQRRQLESQATPMFEYYQRTQQERDKAEFFKEFPKLAKFGKIVQFAASTISPTNADGTEKTVAQAKKEIAQAAKDLLKESGVDIDQLGSDEDDGDGADTTHSAAPSKRSNVPQMSRMQGSGRSGGPQAKGASNNPDADIYN